jgi:hypothetical protein
MSGFCRVSFEGEFFNQQVVNVFHYRSATWLPGGGNPFDDVLATMDDIITELKTEFLNNMNPNYTLANVKGVGYDDAYGIVTSSPLVRNLGEAGTAGIGVTNGAAPCAIIGLRCGEQVQINGLVKSKRNRGYLAIGPLSDTWVDDFSHIVPSIITNLDGFAQLVDNQIVSLGAMGTLIPVRIHEVYSQPPLPHVLVGRTYSDVLGYTVNRVASYRRSRQPEA